MGDQGTGDGASRATLICRQYTEVALMVKLKVQRVAKAERNGANGVGFSLDNKEWLAHKSKYNIGTPECQTHK